MRSTAPFVYVVAFVLAFGSAFGCGGGGCACMTPIPGGFPAAERTPNAAQVRVSQTGIDALTADPQALVEGLTGGPLTFDVPASCDGTPTTCCPGGNPVTPCGPIVVDLGFQEGDDPRLEIRPAQGASRIDVTVRARVHTEMDVPISAIGADCTLVIDTTAGDLPDIQVDAAVNFVQDADTGTTRVEVGDVVITNFTDQDYEIEGGLACAFVNWGSQFFMDTLTGTFADAIKGAIEDQTCKACPSGDVAECGPAAAACTDGVCMKANDTCVQELGVSGRMLGALPGTTGGIDIYEVAGGYATTDNGGIALGLLGGMLPAGQPRDRCGPPATAPAPVTIPQSTFFQGNQRPDTSAPFDVAIGVHQNQLDRFAYSAYDGGMLCLTVGSSTIDLINTGSIGLFIPSLSKLANTAAPMAIGLRPQAPPTIVLGPNTFIDDGMGNLTVDEPLLDLTFLAMEIDFFAMVEGQYIRIFTLVADVHLPVGLDVGAAGDIVPVLGDLEGAFTNITVKNSEPLLETPEELADIFPTILQLALGQLGGLGSFDVPELGGLQVSVTEITAVDGNTFMAIFGELMPAMAAAAPRAETTAMIARVDVPPTATFADARSWRGARRPTVDLALGGAGLEWQTRVDGVSWSAWSPHAERTLAADTFWVQGRHTIEVRARRAGEPWSADPTPVVMHTLIDTIAPAAELEAAPTFVRVRGTDNVAGERLAMRYRFGDGAWTESPIGVPIALAGRDLAGLEVEVRDAAGNAVVATGAAAKPAPFHGQPGESGCSCGASSPGAGGGLLALLTAALLLRPRRRVRRAAAFVILCGLMPACDCGSDPPCGDVACLEGDVEHGPVGKHNSVASDGTRTVVSTYDQRLGDLVVVDVIPGSEPVHVAVDGIPDETPTHEPSSYRGGIEGAGTDVGWWTSIALHDGAARVAYQDVTYGDLRFARENDNAWTTYTIDDDPATAGAYASLALAPSGAAAVAYLATGVDDGTDVRAAELRLARADTENPDADEWTVTTLASAPSSCGGLCGAGTECVKPVNAGEPEVCAAPTSDCAAACADTEACVAGACRAVVGEPLADHPQGTGLFANAMFLADGRIAIVHYDRARTALVLLVESAAGSSSFTETILDDAGDRGFWASAVTDGNTIHVAYQDALGDQLLYVSWNGAVQPVEIVDDGVREGDRTHPVGAGASIYLDGASPAIAYQDGLVADLVLARRDGGTWTHEAIATGALLDGFHVAATSNGPWIVWDSADISLSPVTTLQIREP